MTKKILSLTAIMALTASTSFAASQYFQFEGLVLDIAQYPAASEPRGSAVPTGLNVGDTVTYIFEIDLDRSAYTTYGDDYTWNWIDESPNDYFYAKYTSGSSTTEVDGGYYNSTNLYTSNVIDQGIGQYNALSDTTTIFSNSSDEAITLQHSGLPTDWTTETINVLNPASMNFFDIWDQNYDSNGNHAQVYSRVILTNITQQEPSGQPLNTPIPQAAWLLGSGLIGLLGLRRRSQQN